MNKCALAALAVAAGLMVACEDPSSALERELQEAEERLMEHEDLIAECMRERGWEYIPALPADAVIEREHALADAAGREPPDPEDLDLPEDPNEAIIAELADAEKEARADAYWGDLDRGGTDPGCYSTTYEQAWGFDPFDPEIEQQALDMEAALQADSRVVQAVRQYVECVAEEGYEVSGTGDLFDHYIDREQELGARRDTEGDSDALQEEWDALQAEKYAAFEVHDGCIVAYDSVEEHVRGEYIEEHDIGP